MGGLPACVYTTFNMPDTHGQKKVALTGITGGCELCSQSSLGLLEVHRVLLTMEPFFSPIIFYLKKKNASHSDPYF